MRGSKTVRIKGLQEFRDRTGRLRRYHRKSRTPIDPSLDGIELALEIERLNKQYETLQPRIGSLGALIGEYQAKSNHWRGIRDRTRKDYRRVFSYLEKLEAMDTVLVEITTPDIAITRDYARDDHEPKFANLVVTVLRKVFEFGLEYGHLSSNPALGVTKATGGNKRPNRPYSAHEIATIIDMAPKQLVGPIYAAAIYGLREGDIVTLSKTADRGDWLTPVTSKRKKPAWLYVTQTMRRIIEEQESENATTVFVNTKGMPWTTDGLRSTWGKFKDKLTQDGLIEPGGTFHGFRHSVTTLLEENGYDATEIRFLVTHAPKNQTEHYSISAQRKELVKKMVLCLENLITEARGNVVRFENKS